MNCIKILLLCFFLMGCSQSPEETQKEARKELAELNITYSKESFVTAVLNFDSNVVTMFLQAGMSPDVQFDFAPFYINYFSEGLAEHWKPFIERAINTKDSMAIHPVEVKLNVHDENEKKAKLRILKNSEYAVLTGTPISFYSLTNKFQSINTLCKYKADTNIAIKTGYGSAHTAISLAVEKNHLESVKALLECGADLNIKNEGQHLPIVSSSLQGALQSNIENNGDRDRFLEIIELIQDYGGLKGARLDFFIDSAKKMTF